LREAGVALGARTPQEAWHAVHTAGLIPADWLDSHDRRFFKSGAVPPSADAVAAFAADVDGVLAVEAAARVLADRLSRWLDRPVTTSRVHWRMLADVDRSTMEWEDHMVYGLGGEAVTKLLMDAAGPDRWGYRMPALTNAGELVAASARLPEEWREAVQGVAAIVSAAQHWSEAAREVDPFEPLLAIWSRGYGVLDVARHVTLLAPGLE